VLTASGFEPNQRFNALHGRSRLIFTDAVGLHLDVIVGEFSMCHRLDLGKRLAISKQTLSLADLLLTKLQIAALNAKDVCDVAALLIDHPLADDERAINQAYIAQVLAQDWGWWRTVTANLDLFERHAGAIGLEAAARSLIAERVQALRARIAGAPKTMRWKSRALLGERVPWRNDPEEIPAG
jgi:hypothetical protein